MLKDDFSFQIHAYDKRYGMAIYPSQQDSNTGLYILQYSLSICLRLQSLLIEPFSGLFYRYSSCFLRDCTATFDEIIQAWSGETNIFITPGYRFKTADILMTNFHLPHSTLFMLVSAFCGLDTMHDAYRYAIESGYRFYSYGNCCLLFRGLSC